MKNALVIDAADLHYHPDNQVFSTDLAMLEHKYPDIGLNEKLMVKGKTAIVNFLFEEVKRDREGDVEFWRFYGKHNGKTYQLKVFND